MEFSEYTIDGRRPGPSCEELAERRFPLLRSLESFSPVHLRRNVCKMEVGSQSFNGTGQLCFQFNVLEVLGSRHFLSGAGFGITSEPIHV